MKGKKYIVPLLLAGVTTASAGYVTNINQYQQNYVHAETGDITDIAGAELKMVGGFKDIYTLGTDTQIEMPKVTVSGATNGNKYTVTYEIKRGNNVMYSETAEAESTAVSPSKKFEPKFTGAYDVTIRAEKEGVVVSEITGLTIMVEKPDAVINMPVNSKYVIPAKMPQKQDGFKIPAPTVTVEKAEVGEDGVTTEEKTARELGTNFVVSLVTPEKTEPLSLADADANGGEDYYTVDKELLATAGTYQIRYEYKNGGATISKLESNFQVVSTEDFKVEDIQLYMRMQGSVPSTGNVGTDIEVPTVTVVDGKNSTDAINAHVTIQYAKLDSNGQQGEKHEVEYKYDSSAKKMKASFHPTEEGNYVLFYQADIDLFDKHTEGLYTPAVIIKVQDKQAPTVRPTYRYNVDENGKITDYNKSFTPKPTEGADDGKIVINDGDVLSDIFENRNVDVPSVVVKESGQPAKFRLPAIWGEDNKDSYNDITFTREIVGNNIAKITVEADASDVSEEIKLNATGNYEVRYIATDKAGNTTRATYSLVVKDKEDDKTELANGKTTINLSVGVSTITDKGTLKFNAPKVKDDFDSYLDTEVGYYLLKVDDLTGAEVSTALASGESGDSMHILKLNSDGKYEIKIADAIKEHDDVKAILVVTKATADSTLKGTRTAFENTTKTFTYKMVKITKTTGDTTSAELKIKNGTGDGVETTLDASTWNKRLYEANKDLFEKPAGEESEDGFPYNVKGIAKDGYASSAENGENGEIYVNGKEGAKLAPFDQGQETPLKIPAMVFVDSDANLKVRLTIKDIYGNNVSKYTYETVSKEFKSEKYEYTIENASFILSQSGIYTVTFRAEDANGNVTSRTMGIRVNDRTAPTIVVEDEDKYGVEIEVGEFFEVPYGVLYKEDQIQEGRDVYWDVEASAGAEMDIQDTGFTPLTEGTFYVHYYGTDFMENPSLLEDRSKFFVRAVDNTDPVFNEDSSYSLSPNMAWTPDNDENQSESMKVLVPKILATDPVRNVSVDVNMTITSPDGSNVTVREITKDDTKFAEHIDDCVYFIATKQGVYNIKYEASDVAGHTISKTVDLSIGDCIAPTITWADGSTFANIENNTITMKQGDTLSLALSQLTIKDNVTTDNNFLANNMSIKLTKPDGTTDVTNTGTDNNNYKFTLSDTGTYTLTIIVKDEAGQSNTYRYYIDVPSESMESNTISPVIGTVLVVLAVAVLAGVVIYFVVSSRKKDGKSKAKKKN